MIRHIVFTKFENPGENVPAARALLEALPAKIPEIVSLETGSDFLGSERSWDMALVVTLRSREDLAVYAEHPEHQKVKAYIHAHRTGTATVDYDILSFSCEKESMQRKSTCDGITDCHS